MIGCLGSKGFKKGRYSPSRDSNFEGVVDVAVAMAVACLMRRDRLIS